ncbi:Sin3 complex subunit Stb2 [Cordyceps fumosorosea ARSEF 2679]|uniref:Sin3 complex subunit Stb2 n=1 Tax=Cordyceps fumosorosea (strain ARSEF 2679) TaxID=1081104 RepID=A0A167V0H6_CORFA|nr:Sin3 complex subunit Stb2 [Cordyceps fumosorosea ARSEF 2679]OAA62094.1 Sin3 complex subunit Stb2 [Cordyceps fumosorosea ARSEF 2679]
MPMPADGRHHLQSAAPARAVDCTTSRAAARDGPTSSADAQIQDAAAQALATAVMPRRHVIFPDPVAFRFLQNEPYVSLVERQTFLSGYELYLVEQWACSRGSPTLVVATHTGDDKDRISAGILSIPDDNTLWSARLQLFFKAANQYHARPKETGMGQLLVTNLSNFPSSLTVIPVPDGDIRRHRQTFIVNEDLKRLGCAGRSGLTLTEPPEATRSKFHQLYKTSERIPFMQSVTELIKLCQVALYMFDKLEPEYIDGLLCDVTEAAISDWWTEIGAEHYNYEPSDGILGPSTVAALLGMLMGARNRLSWQGAPVSKDVFDIESTKRGISYFQKSQKLDKTRRLDRQTLFRLHNSTAKAAAGEGWGVQKAVNSTVTGIGGKRGEIVMDMVSGKDKGGLADVETLDLDRFIKLAYGEQSKWLWHGKQRRAPLGSRDLDHELGGLLLGRSDLSGHASRTANALQADDEAAFRRQEDPQAAPPSRMGTGNTYDSVGDRDGGRRTVFKSVAGNAKSGLDRIKDAVGGTRRGHARWPSSSNRDDLPENLPGLRMGLDNARSSGAMTGPATVGRAFTWREKPEEYLAALRRGDPDALRGLQATTALEPASADPAFFYKKEQLGDAPRGLDTEQNLQAIGAEVRDQVLSRAPSAVRSAIDETDFEGPLLESERTGDQRHLRLCRRHSSPSPAMDSSHAPNENRYPRRLSFSNAEEAILGWEEIIPISDSTGNDTGSAAAQTELLAQLARQVDLLVNGVGPWVGDKIKLVETLDERYGKDAAELAAHCRQLGEACERVRMDSEGIVADERQRLQLSIKELETMVAQLDYELNALASKVHEVEDGIVHFERQVVDIEARADELKTQLETESWLHWFVRTLTGVGTGPNITRSV